MALVEEFDNISERSDEASESEMLDKSLSVWRGWKKLKHATLFYFSSTMALVEEFDNISEGSDEASESEMLDKSLSVWRGWKNDDEPDFEPVPLDPYTASSIGDYDCVWAVVQR